MYVSHGNILDFEVIGKQEFGFNKKQENLFEVNEDDTFYLYYFYRKTIVVSCAN